MVPLSDRSINVLSPSLHHARYNELRDQHPPRLTRKRDENSTPLNRASSKTPSSRLLSQTKASAARSNSSPSPSTQQQTPSLASRLPRRAETPNSAKAIVSKGGRGNLIAAVNTRIAKRRLTPAALDTAAINSRSQTKSATAPNMAPPPDKDLPPRPVATYNNMTSPTKDGRTLLDADERPLRQAPGTPSETDWPTLSPVRQATAPSSPQVSTSRDAAVLPMMRNLYPYFPDQTMRSHWSADTPETPASTVAPPHLFDEPDDDGDDDYDNVHPSPEHLPPGVTSSAQKLLNRSTTFPSMSEFYPQPQSPTPRPTNMMHVQTRDDRDRSGSPTDRTSNGTATMSTINTTDFNNDSTEVTQESERPHSPSPCSFSQPRVNHKRDSLPGTPTPHIPLYNSARHHATASRIPIYDPRKTPNIVDIKSRTPAPETPNAEAAPSFGGCRLDTQADLAALDKDPRTMRQPSNRTLGGQSSLDHYGFAKKVSLVNMKHQIRKLTPSPLLHDLARPHRAPRKFSITSQASREDSDTHTTRNISGQLSTTTFQGTTLTIHKEADFFLLDTPGRERKANKAAASEKHAQELLAASQSNAIDTAAATAAAANMQVELSLAFDGPNQHSPVAQRTVRADLADLMAAREGQDNDHLPGATIVAENGETNEQITATLSLLEGTPPSRKPTNEDYLDFAMKYGKRVRPYAEHPAFKQRDGSPGSEVPQDMMRDASSGLAYVEGGNSHAQSNEEQHGHRRSPTPRGNDRMPSYMNPTPASEARRVHKSQSQSKDDKYSIFPTPASSKTSRVGENDFPPRNGLGKRTPSKATLTRGASSTHTPLSPFPPQPAVMPSVAAQLPPAVRPMHRVGYTTPEPGFKHRHRPRSESKSRFISNVKGFFSSSKKEVLTSVPATAGTAASARNLHKINLNAHGNPAHGESTICITESSPSRAVDKPLPDPQSPPRATPTPLLREEPSGISLPIGITNTDSSQALINVCSALMAEAGSETDSTKKERLLHLAKVMIDTVSNSREAEKSMVAAQQAAEAAQTSYELTQKSMQEMSRMVANTKGGVGSVLRRIAARGGH